MFLLTLKKLYPYDVKPPIVDTSPSLLTLSNAEYFPRSIYMLEKIVASSTTFIYVSSLVNPDETNQFSVSPELSVTDTVIPLG
jgi:hypothetical protein